ncbi:MAG: YncE family protein [Candidatus Aegiribacteria sp.]|nr:YncE family protein [Candidatus Aegiribacteria sp.]
MKNVITIALSIGIVLLSTCGDNTGPSGSDISPSTLSVNFTGQACKSGAGNTQEHAAAPVLSFTGQNSTGQKSNCLVTAFWSVCSDHAFSSYILYRSESSDISSDPSSADVVCEITSPNTTLYVDSDIIWETQYFYVLKTADSDGNGVWSNEVSITTPVIDSPTPSVLSVEDVTWYNVDLSWTTCPNPNFESYRLYRSLTPNIEDDSTLADIVCDLSWSLDTAYTDTTVTFSTLYHYAMLTTNTEDRSSWSNEISVNTTMDIPDDVVATIDVGNDPWGITSLPSGNYIYVTNRGDDNVSVIRTSDNSVTATINVGEKPYGICALPSGSYVYVTNWGSDNVSVIRTSDNAIVATIDVGTRPVGICTLPSGEYVYVTNRDDNNVSVIRTSDNSVIETVDAGTNPYRICSLPSGEYLYVTNWSSNSVSVIRTSDNSVVKTINMFTNPIGICTLPSGEYVYVSNYGNDLAAIIRTSDNSVMETVDVGNGPWGIHSHPSGECIYVADSTDDTISLIRASDNQVVRAIDVGRNPSSICSLPTGTAVYIVNYADGTISVMQ